MITPGAAARYNSLTQAAQINQPNSAPAPPTEGVPSGAMGGSAESLMPAQASNLYPRSGDTPAASSPTDQFRSMVPTAGQQIPTIGLQQQQQQQQTETVGNLFLPVLMGLHGISERYPQYDDVLRTIGGQIQALMTRIAAEASQSPIPRSLT